MAFPYEMTEKIIITRRQFNEFEVGIEVIEEVVHTATATTWSEVYSEIAKIYTERAHRKAGL